MLCMRMQVLTEMSLHEILPVINFDHIECIMCHGGQFVCRGTLELLANHCLNPGWFASKAGAGRAAT
jgi:hypothetical protein